jgi:hypothetical protein
VLGWGWFLAAQKTKITKQTQFCGTRFEINELQYIKRSPNPEHGKPRNRKATTPVQRLTASTG